MTNKKEVKVKEYYYNIPEKTVERLKQLDEVFKQQQENYKTVTREIMGRKNDLLSVLIEVAKLPVENIELTEDYKLKYTK